MVTRYRYTIPAFDSDRPQCPYPAMPSATAGKRIALGRARHQWIFFRPDPLSRPANSVAGGLARPQASVSKCRSTIDGHPHAPAHTTWL